MNFRRLLLLSFCLALLAVASPGCSDQYAGQNEVSGNVTLEKQPLKEGSISFVPLESQGTITGAGIKDGVYKVPRQSGLKPGKYLVRITAGDGKTPATDDENAGGPGGNSNIVSVDIIPEEWNANSKKEVEVKSGSNKFDFDIPNRNTKKAKKGR